MFGITAVLTAGGILTFALFPLILPSVVLLGILAIPLVPFVVLGAIVYGVYRIVRSISRRRSGSASRSISTILPTETVKPATAKDRPSRTTTNPAAPST